MFGVLPVFGVFPVFGVAGHKRSIIVVEVPLAAAVDNVVTRNVISLFVMLDDMQVLLSTALYLMICFPF